MRIPGHALIIQIMTKRIAILFLSALMATAAVRAQAPTGTIAGVVTDAAGAALAGARVIITSRTTGLIRQYLTSEDGDYSAASLPSGEYQITAEATGFSPQKQAATVEAGTTTRVDLPLQVGAVSEQVAVNTAAPRVQYEQHQVSGLVRREQIEDLPLNGRNFLDLAKLEPGVQPPARAGSNRVFVPALGQPMGNAGRGTRVTVDGGSVMTVGSGGTGMSFSQEVVQEFQVATVNFDLTTGLTNGAAVNVVTRAGNNELHGTGFYFFRDHTLAAYPALIRDAADEDPFFQRRQFGFAIGGPIRRDRLFFFANWERNEQRGVGATTLFDEFAHLSRITPSPFFGNHLSLRLDGRLSDRHTAFLRHTHDGLRALGAPTNQPSAYPSTWSRQLLWADQSILGLTSVLKNALVNDLRFSFFYLRSSNVGPTEADCPGCLGMGSPSITVPGMLTVGTSVGQQSDGRRYHLNDYLTWQKSAHRLRFGVDWEYNRGGMLTVNAEPASLTLFSPQRTLDAGFSVPPAFRTVDDLLKLPLQSASVGIGNPRVPQADGGLVPNWHTLRLFFQDTWRLDSRLTLTYGLGWSVDRNLNYDLTKPALLAPILGTDGLGPTRKRWKNFSPVLGLARALGSDRKTVVRAGAGHYYDFLFFQHLDAERILLGPPGLGRQVISGNRLRNCLPDIAGVPLGRPLNFQNPTRFTGADLLACLPAIRAELERELAAGDPALQAIQVSKQGVGINPVDLPTHSATHFNVGLQREVAQDFVVTADFVYRHFIHVGLGQLDLNHFNSERGPVIAECKTAAERNDPRALCSTGRIGVQTNAGRVAYKGLLVRADKRFSHGFQLLGSWAYSSTTGSNVGNGFNLDDWLGNRGPLDRDLTHIVNLAGVAQLPWRFKLGLNFSYASAPPFSAYIGGRDFNGDGTTGDLLPGTTVNAFNRGLGRAELEGLVAQFNQTYAGTLDRQGALIPRLMLPEAYEFGDDFHSLDLRLSREMVFEGRWRLTLIGEVFNAYNAANLSGHGGDLTATGSFGRPTSRATQVFGSGGPRAFQLGARVSF